MAKVRLEDIAKECGVTKGLVSRALAGKYNVSDDTRNKIMQKAIELGYDFEHLRSKPKRKKTVMLVIASSILLKEDFWQPIIKNLYGILNRSSITLEYFVFDKDHIDIDAVKKLKDSHCLAFVVLHVNPDEVFKELCKFNKPIIEVDPKVMHTYGVTQIKFSNYNSIYEATEMLYKYGHRSICFFGSDMHALSFRERHEGFLACIDAYKDKGLKGINVIFDNSNFQYSDNAMLKEALINNPDITAIICANDICAINAYKIIQSLGKQVPYDYSVIGFDNVQAGNLVVPPLSTFNVPREKIGDEIGRYVVGIISDDRPQYSVFVVRCEYIERQSVRKIK